MNLNALKAMIEHLSPEELDQLRVIINNMTTDTTKAPDVAEVFAKSSKPATTEQTGNDMDFTMSTPRRKKEAVRASGKNMFTDDGSDAKDDENSTPEYTPTPRRRKAPTTRNVQCSACGKTFAKHASLIHGEYHRCDRCCGR